MTRTLEHEQLRPRPQTPPESGVRALAALQDTVRARKVEDNILQDDAARLHQTP